MKLNRADLLKVLKLLSPAVAGPKNQMTELSHIWLDGQYLSAFNDVLGIRVEFVSEFKGGLPGEKLIGLLEHSSQEFVDFSVEPGSEDVQLKIGAANFKLSYRPIEDWFWQPDIPSEPGFAAAADFREAIKAVMLSIGASNAVNPEQRGVTVIQNGGDAMYLYTTDAVSLSRVRFKTASRLCSVDRLVLPTPFCEQLTSLRGEAELRFDENAAYCLTQAEVGGRRAEVLIFSKLVEDEEDPVSFEEVISDYGVDAIVGVEIPDQLKSRADRALVLLGDDPIALAVEDDNLYLYALTSHGEVDDVLKFGGHPKVEAKIDMALMRRALDSCDRMTIATNGIVMTGPKDFLHLFACK